MRISIKYNLSLVLIFLINTFILTFIFAEEVVDKPIAENELSVTAQWAHQCNVPNNHRTFLAGECISGFITISNFQQEQIKEHIKATVSIFDEKEKKLIHTFPTSNGVIKFLYIDPNLKNSTFQILGFNLLLPNSSILPKGNYVLKLAIKDQVSNLYGVGKFYFNIVSPDTFRLMNVGFIYVISNATSRKNVNPPKDLPFIACPTFVIPMVNNETYIPNAVCMVNGLSVNENDKVDLHIKFTQYSEKGDEIWKEEHFYTDKNEVKDKPFLHTYSLKLYSGKYHIKIEIEDRIAKKKDSIELPYAVFNGLDMLK
jgi:hypothetical protein